MTTTLCRPGLRAARQQKRGHGIYQEPLRMTRLPSGCKSFFNKIEAVLTEEHRTRDEHGGCTKESALNGSVCIVDQFLFDGGGAPPPSQLLPAGGICRPRSGHYPGVGHLP